VISTAWHLIRAEQTPDAEIVAGSAEMSHARLASRGFYPLTFPLTVGPGSLSVALTLGAEVGSGSGLQATWGLGAVVGIALVASTIYLCYRFASRLLRALGTTGSVVLLRMSAFILLAVGVKILCDGLVERFVGAQ
jgi:multiple antibiotic resistance protein